MKPIAPITRTELLAAFSQGLISLREYLPMAKMLRDAYEARPDCVDWLAEEGQV